MAPDSPGLLERSCTLTGNAQSITYVIIKSSLITYNLNMFVNLNLG